MSSRYLTTNINSQNIYELERLAAGALNDLSHKAAAYAKCRNENRPNCSSAEYEAALVTANERVTALRTALTPVTNKSATIDNSGTYIFFDSDDNPLSSYDDNNAISRATALTNHDNIMKKYNKLLDKRNELDHNMKEYLNTEKSITNDSFNHYNSVMYSSIMMSVLATSVLYYIFTKL